MSRILNVFRTDCFTLNKKLLTGYVIRAYEELGERSLKAMGYTNNRDASIIASLLLELNDYDRFFEFIITHPEAINHIYARPQLNNHAKIFVNLKNFNNPVVYKNLNLFSEENYDRVITESMKASFYYWVLQSITERDSKVHFIAASVIVGIPEELYRDALLNSLELFEDTMRYICTEFIDKSQFIDSNIYVVIENLIQYLISGFSVRNTNSEAVSRNAQLLNRIRFGPNITEASVDEILETVQINELMHFALAAALANKTDLVLRSYDRLKEVGINVALEACNMNNGFGLIISIIQNIIDNEERQHILDNHYALELFKKYYFVNDFNHNSETRKITLKLKLKSTQQNLSLPVTFYYTIRDELHSMNVPSLINSCFDDSYDDAEYDHDSLLSIINGLNNWENSRIFLESNLLETIRTSSQILKVISNSQELANAFRNSGIRFSANSENVAKLFDKPADNLMGILIGVKPFDVLRQLHSNRQFSNLEAFLGLNVAEIFQEHFIPLVQREGVDPSAFYCLRNVFHYWLSGSHRERFNEIIDPLFKDLMALEVDIPDSRFLHTVTLGE